MPNIAALLKSEIARVARKEVRAETQSLKKAVATYRSEIAELKKRTQALEQELRRVAKAAQKAAPAVDVAEEQGPALRFSAKGFASQRQRLGLSAADCGLLLGASGLSVYKWESGQSRPRAKFLPAIAAFRSLGKKEAAARLEALR
jgi:DNA-binding transcriptional regulator YiaG